MIGGILNSIPGVGHAKGFLHYMSGDVMGGNKAMVEATRSTAVIAGGAVGALGGPVGMYAGAALAGAYTDVIRSAVTQEPKGIVAGVADIATDISNGEVPVRSVLRTTMQVGVDVVGGIAGPTLGNVATKAITESTAKGVVIKISQSGLQTVTSSTLLNGTCRSIITHDSVEGFSDCHSSPNTKSSSSSNSSSKPSSNTGSSTNTKTNTSQSNDDSNKKSSQSSDTSASAGGQAPNNPNNNNNNKNNKNKTKKEPAESHMDKFLKIFQAKQLEDILIRGKHIFKGINNWQKKELKDFVISINNSYKHLDLTRIIQITLALLNEVPLDQVTSHNFVNIAKLVLAYLCEELTDTNETLRNSNESFEKSREKHGKNVTSENAYDVSSLLKVIMNLMKEIGELSSTTDPQFVNTIAGVYHYFKHKFIKHVNRLFSPVEYMNLARDGLNRMRAHPQYEVLRNSGVTRITYQRYYKEFGRRLRIVIKLQGSKWNLSSCYYEDEPYVCDEDGKEWVTKDGDD